MTSFSSGMIGLSLLSGSDVFSAMSAAAPTIETRAQRRAKAAFTAEEPATPPWKVATKTSESARLSAIKAMKTIVDKGAPIGEQLDTDVQTTFTAYKALDRLQLLAATAAKDTTSTAERASLQKLFARGLTDLKTYLGAAPSDKVDLAFGRLARQAQSVSIAAPSSLSKMTIAGKGVVKERVTPIDAMTGTEKFRIDLSATGISDSITVDLTGGPVPPTLDSVASAINGAIAALPKRDAGGQILLDEAGQPVPRWAVKIEPSKTGDKWGLSVQRGGFETIAIDQIGAGDAIMVASGVTGTNAKGAATPTDTRISRFDDPAGTMTRQTLGTLTSVDSEATDRPG